MKRYIILLIFLEFSVATFGQSGCNYGNHTDASKLCNFYKRNSFATDRSADIALDMILSVTGLSTKNFVLKQCDDISNCVATSYKGKRYILYDKDFMNIIANNTNSWSYLSILAHEIGHHVEGHSLDLIVYASETVEPPTLSESREMELEADEYSGFIMYKLGASLSQAQQAIRLISTNADDTYSTHPRLDKRLSAIEKGYNKSKEAEEKGKKSSAKKTKSQGSNSNNNVNLNNTTVKGERLQMRDAEKIAVNWLNKLNNKKYLDCWDMFSAATQKLTNYKEWHAYFSMELMPELGDFISRKYYLAEMEKEIKGLPKGIYVTVRYQSQYTNTNTVEEILLLSQNEIGTWKILSYLVEYELKDDSGDVPKSRFK